MKFKDFKNYLDKTKKVSDNIDSLYKLNIDLINFSDQFFEVELLLLREIYTEEGIDWITWYRFERHNDDTNPQAWDENKNPICGSPKALWEYVEKHHKK